MYEKYLHKYNINLPIYTKKQLHWNRYNIVSELPQ